MKVLKSFEAGRPLISAIDCPEFVGKMVTLKVKFSIITEKVTQGPTLISRLYQKSNQQGERSFPKRVEEQR